jgi:hypothetical protein
MVDEFLPLSATPLREKRAFRHRIHECEAHVANALRRKSVTFN